MTPSLFSMETTTWQVHPPDPEKSSGQVWDRLLIKGRFYYKKKFLGTCSQTLFGNRLVGFICETKVRLQFRSKTKFWNERGNELDKCSRQVPGREYTKGASLILERGKLFLGWMAKSWEMIAYKNNE